MDDPVDDDLDGAGVGVPRRRLLLRPRRRASAAGTRAGTGFLAVTTFATLLGIATLLHWDRFIHDHVAFWLWAGLYFTRRSWCSAPGSPTGGTPRRRPPTTLLLRPAERAVDRRGRARRAGDRGVVMFLAPSAVIDLWPWPLTPLTCRVVAAVFCLGGAGVGVVARPALDARCG